MPILKLDRTLADATDVARTAAVAVAEPGLVGEHLGFAMDADRLGTHRFACTHPGYPDWQWSVVVTRVSRSKIVTVSEIDLLPTAGSIVAPEWVPYSERLRPGDLGAGDVNPYVADDPCLEPGFEATGEEDVDQMAQWELGLGRPRVLSAQGREVAAQRWYDGDNGPTSEVAKQAPAPCSSCGYFVPMAGALRATFGVCANEWSPSDGKVVSLDHGCGAHSEADVEPHPAAKIDPMVVDDLALQLSGPLSQDAPPSDAPAQDPVTQDA